MSLRPPQFLSTSPRFETGLSVLEAEVASERAVALGRLGREVQSSLARLAAAAPGDARAPLVRAAAQTVWSYFVQREACGLLDHTAVVADYAIPPEVLARVGAMD
jgi:hypothetical protein